MTIVDFQHLLRRFIEPSFARIAFSRFLLLRPWRERTAQARPRRRPRRLKPILDLHLLRLGHADPLHDGMRERGRSQDRKLRRCFICRRDSPSRRPCRSWRQTATSASNTCRSRFTAWAKSTPARFSRTDCFIFPNKYVVPGGRFNEMYGWDSYFIIRGLLRAGRVELARGMVDNFFFESNTTARCSTRIVLIT